MLLEIQGLSKRYGKHVAVDSVSVDVVEGQFVSLLGPSGSGKSTILRMVAGLITPDAGAIAINGKTVSGNGRDVPPEKRNIGMVFQDYALWPHMTVAQNIAFGLRLRHWPRSRVRTRVGEMLDLVRLDELERRYPFELSGGQQQRVALARALASDPQLILLDEPLSNLDMQLRMTLREELVALLKRVGMTSLYVTHDYTEAMEMSDTMVVLRDGRLEQCGPPSYLYTHPANLFVETFLGATNRLYGRLERRGTLSGIVFGDQWLQGEPHQELDGVAVLCIRPEAVELDGTGSAKNTVAGTLLRTGFLGNYWQHVYALPGDTRLQMTTPQALELPIGESINLYLPPERCRLLTTN